MGAPVWGARPHPGMIPATVHCSGCPGIRLVSCVQHETQPHGRINMAIALALENSLGDHDRTHPGLFQILFLLKGVWASMMGH